LSRIPLVPPGLGKPSTHSRNYRRRLKKGYEKDALLAGTPGTPNVQSNTTIHAPSSSSLTLGTSKPFDWDRLERLWEESAVLEKLDQRSDVWLGGRSVTVFYFILFYLKNALIIESKH
jgi:hypothetical protein